MATKQNMLVSRATTNLLGGVSQQPDILRASIQCESQVNMLSSPVEGLRIRPCSEHIAKLTEESIPGAKVHFIDRDDQERYTCLFESGDLKVFDSFTGEQKTVNFPNGKAYLNSYKPRDTVKALTIADYTFVANSGVKARASRQPYKATDKLTTEITATMPAIDNLYAVQVNTLPFPSWLKYFSNFMDAKAYLQTRYETLYGAGLEVSNEFYAYGQSGVTINAMAHLLTTLIAPVIWSHPTSAVTPTIYYLPKASLESGICLMEGGSYNSGSCIATLEYPGYPNTPEDTGLEYSPDTVGIGLNGDSITIPFNPEVGSDSVAYDLWAELSGRATALNIHSVTQLGNKITLVMKEGYTCDVYSLNEGIVDMFTMVDIGLMRGDALFIVVTSGVAEQTYKVSIDGNVAEYTTDVSTNVASFQVNEIATQLATQIAGWATFQAVAYGNIVMVKRTTGTLEFDYMDTWNSQAMYVMRNRIAKVEDLPAKFVEGVPIEVGDEGYYVHYITKKRNEEETDAIGMAGQSDELYVRSQLKLVGGDQTLVAHTGWNALEGSEQGVWEECAVPYARSTLIPETMPHALIREANGEFTFKTLNWAKRECGDELSAASPSFVGKTIVDLAFSFNRLIAITDESMVMSRSGEFFNFWKQSARDGLDTDPIDVLVSHSKVSSLSSAVSFSNRLLIFSDNVQFLVYANGAMTPKTCVVQPATEFESSRKLKPVSSGSDVYFATDRGSYTLIKEYYVAPNQVQNAASDVTGHVPRYIPANAFKAAVSTTDDLLVILTDQEPNNMYVYKYAWNGETKVLESWSKWTFNGAIVSAEFVRSKLYVVIDRGGFYLEVMDLQSLPDSVGYEVMLDRKVKLTGTQISGTQARYTTPYPALVFNEGCDSSGNEITWYPETDTTILVDTLIADDIYFGEPINASYQFSKFYVRDKEDKAIAGTGLKLKTLTAMFTGEAINVTVENPARDMALYSYPRVGTEEVLQKEYSLRVGVQADGTETKVTILNETHKPMYVSSIMWEGQYLSRATRI